MVDDGNVNQVDDVPFDDVLAVIGNYDICIVKNMRLNADAISCANRTKLIMQYGVGLKGVDINAATKHGIKVARIPGGATGNNEMHIAVKQKLLGEPVGETLLGKKATLPSKNVLFKQYGRWTRTNVEVHQQEMSLWDKNNIRIVESLKPSKGRLYYMCDLAGLGGCDLWAWCNPVGFASSYGRDEILPDEKSRVEEGVHFNGRLMKLEALNMIIKASMVVLAVCFISTMLMSSMK
ncbi:unnamed protein product [Camellia sinensis]